MDCEAQGIAISLELEGLGLSRMINYIISAHRIPFIFKFCGKEFPFSYPRHKDMVAFPQVKIKNLFIWNPFQPAFR